MITQAELKTILHYEPSTGLFTWIKPTSNRVRVGASAGTLQTKENRYNISINGTKYKAHRLAWLYMFGVWPNHWIDHIDGDSTNNKISNLRDVNNTVNMENLKVAHKDSTVGLLGVHRNGSGYLARICVDGKRLCLGTFKTPEEAHVKYLDTKRRLHFGCTI